MVRHTLFFVLVYSAPRKCVFCRKNVCLLNILPRSSGSMRPPGVFKRALAALFLCVLRWVLRLCKKNLLTSRLKCSFAAPPVHTPPKMYDSLVQNGCDLKNLYHSALELQFSLQPLQKMPFRCRVLKATRGLHRKRHGFEYFPDTKWPFRTRAVNATIFFCGKTA